MNYTDDYELDDIDPDYSELEERADLLKACAITSMSEGEYRLYINNKLDSIIIYLKSIIDVLTQRRNYSNDRR